MEAVLVEERESVFAGETRRFAARLAGEGEKQMFACVCGYREKRSDFKKRRENRSAGKKAVRRYLEQPGRQEERGSSAMAGQLKK